MTNTELVQELDTLEHLLKELQGKLNGAYQEIGRLRTENAELRELLSYSCKHEWLQTDEAKNERIAELTHADK